MAGAEEKIPAVKPRPKPRSERFVWSPGDGVEITFPDGQKVETDNSGDEGGTEKAKAKRPK